MIYGSNFLKPSFAIDANQEIKLINVCLSLNVMPSSHFASFRFLLVKSYPNRKDKNKTFGKEKNVNMSESGV
jgi:hypothetical protein